MPFKGQPLKCSLLVQPSGLHRCLKEKRDSKLVYFSHAKIELGSGTQLHIAYVI